MEKHVERMESLIQAAGENNPKINGWGIYSYCDVNTPCGDGGGGFFWFDNAKDMLELSRYLCWMFPISADEHDPELFQENGKIIDALVAKQASLEKGKQMLNELLEGSIQVSWWGEVKELLTDDLLFCNDIRSSFWDLRDNGSSETENIQPIPDNLEGEFLQWLKEYV